jgi:hypothetical protein
MPANARGFSPRAFSIWLLARCGGGTWLAGRRRAAAAAFMLAGLLARLLVTWCGRRIGRRYCRWAWRRHGAAAGLSEGRGSGDRKREEGNAGETLEWAHEQPQMVGDRPIVAGLASLTRVCRPSSPRHLAAYLASPNSSKLRIADRCVFPSTSRSASMIFCFGQSMSTTPKLAAA